MFGKLKKAGYERSTIKVKKYKSVSKTEAMVACAVQRFKAGEKKPYEDELMKCADAFVRRPPPNTLLAHAQPPPGRPEPSLPSFLAAPCIL